jgi:hypothetical protein
LLLNRLDLPKLDIEITISVNFISYFSTYS